MPTAIRPLKLDMNNSLGLSDKMTGTWLLCCLLQSTSWFYSEMNIFSALNIAKLAMDGFDVQCLAHRPVCRKRSGKKLSAYVF
jgi:hypothetical protein